MRMSVIVPVIMSMAMTLFAFFLIAHVNSKKLESGRLLPWRLWRVDRTLQFPKVEMPSIEHRLKTMLGLIDAAMLRHDAHEAIIEALERRLASVFKSDGLQITNIPGNLVVLFMLVVLHVHV